MSVSGRSSSEQVWADLECWPPDVSSGGPQVNKFEQVSSVGHQISVDGGPDLISSGLGVYSEIQGIMGNDHMGTPPEKMTYTWENITFLQLFGQVVKMYL